MANWAALQESLVGLPVYKRAKHGIHFKNGNQIVANFSGKPCHYFDGKLWKPLDTKLLAIGTEYGAPGLKPRVKLDGTVRIDGTDYSQRSTRIGIFKPTTKKFTAIKTIPLGSLDGDKLIAESGVWRRELRLTEDGLKEEIIIASKPTNTGATLSDWLVLETAVSGMSFPDGWLNDYEVSEFKFPPPSAHDAEGNEADCKRYARNVNGVQYIYTGVSAVWLNSAVYPVTIDPDFAAGSNNKRIYGFSDTYATARSTSSGSDDEWLSIGQQKSGSTFYIYRHFVSFDTSSIGSGSTVTQVNLKLTVAGGFPSSPACDLQIIKQDWSSGTTEQHYDGCLSGTADDAILGNTGSGTWSAGTQKTSGNLSTAWINKTGTTYYSLRSSRDYAGTENSGDEWGYFYPQKNGTVGYRPVLAVTYTEAAAAAHRLALLGVGK